MHNYESSNGVLPPQMVLTFNASGAVTWKSSWSASSRITPFLEQGSVYNAINYTNKTSDPTNATAVSTQLKVFLCPSEPNQQAFTSTNTAGVTSTYGVSNYGWCLGTWYTFGGFAVRWTDARRDRFQPEPPVRLVHGWTEQHASGRRGQDVHAFLSRLWRRAAAWADGPVLVPRRPHRARERRGGPDIGVPDRHGPIGHARRRPHPLEQRQRVLRRFHHGLAPQHQVPGGDTGPR